MRSYFDGLLRSFEFSGRSTRAQYWLFTLFSIIVCVAAVFADSLLTGVPVQSKELGPLTVFVAVVHTLPTLTVTVRRLHDIGRSGWWYFIYALPVIGAVVMLVWMCWPSDEYANDYGDTSDRGAGSRRRRRETYSTIPRVVRMGSNAARPPSISRDGHNTQERFI